MKHLILIKVRTADPHMTLKFPFVAMCNKRYISKPENKETDQFLGRLSPPCRSFLFSVFLAEFPSGTWVLTKPAYFAWASKIGPGRPQCLLSFGRTERCLWPR